jgi:hypothetical protein
VNEKPVASSGLASWLRRRALGQPAARDNGSGHPYSPSERRTWLAVTSPIVPSLSSGPTQTSPCSVSQDSAPTPAMYPASQLRQVLVAVLLSLTNSRRRDPVPAAASGRVALVMMRL